MRRPVHFELRSLWLLHANVPYVGLFAICRKPVRREELNARIDLHTAMKTDASWLKTLMNGSTDQDTEAMQLLQAIMPQKIIDKIQVRLAFDAGTHLHDVSTNFHQSENSPSCKKLVWEKLISDVYATILLRVQENKSVLLTRHQPVWCMQGGQKFIAETHPHVVVLFSDIVGFTTLS